MMPPPPDAPKSMPYELTMKAMIPEYPRWMKRIGCFGRDRDTFRFRWGELTFGWFNQGLSLRFAPCNHINVSLLVFNLYLNTIYRLRHPGHEHEFGDPSYGFAIGTAGYDTWGILWLHCGGDDNSGNKGSRHVKAISLPWEWTSVDYSYLSPDGEWIPVFMPKRADGKIAGLSEHHPDKMPQPAKITRDYTYVLRDGTMQKRKATYHVVRHEWRWRWFKWLPFPRMRQRNLTINFDGEVGEGTGSWKGGVLGTGERMRRGETPDETFHRFSRTQRFDR